MKMPRPGEQFEGKYEVVETLGEGGFAHVYLARDLEVGRDVAIKVLRPRDVGGYDPNIESRFAREARVIARLQDPHTITMYEFGTTASGLMYMVFEYVRGRDLAVKLRERGPLPPAVVEHVLRQLLSALGEAHARGVVHRDLKPANVVIFEYMDDPWRVKLLDFGIAKPLPEPGGRDLTQLTRDGSVVGTPRYMAPEQFFGEQLTPRTDIYALGLLSIEMLAGEPAFRGPSQEVVRQAVSQEPVPVPRVPGFEGLTQVIARMVAREPELRFGSADDVVAALDAARRGPIGSGPYVQQPGFGGSSSSVEYSSTTSAPRRRAEQIRLIAFAALLTGGFVGVVLLLVAEPAPEPVRSLPPANHGREVPFVATTPEPQSPLPQATASSDAGPDLTTADGCGQKKRTGFIARRAGLGLGAGDYVVYVPSNYDPYRRHPVILMFHNALSDGHALIKDTKYTVFAEREGLILIAPNSTGDSMRPWHSTDDVRLVREAFQATREELCVDDQHVYAIGHGGGGNFTMELRCDFELSAIAFTATGEHKTQRVCDTEHPVPALRLWGNTDRHVPPEGGRGCWDKNMFRSASEVERLWRQRNRSRGKAKTWFKHKGGTCKLHDGKAVFVDCEMNGGHDWPTEPERFELPGCAADPPDFPIGDTIWRFFSEHGVSRIQRRSEAPETDLGH